MLADASHQLRNGMALPAMTRYLKVLGILGRSPKTTPDATPSQSAASKTHQAALATAAHGLADATYRAGILKALPLETEQRATEQVQQVAKVLKGTPHHPRLEMDEGLLTLAHDQSISPTLHTWLSQRTLAPDDLIAGQALFLLGEYDQAFARFEALDGQTATGYLAIGDRLLALQALNAANTMYARGEELARLPMLRDGRTRIRERKALASQRVKEGNRFSPKDV